MSWTYAATDLITGQTRADNIPLQVTSFSRALNGAADLTADLDLTIDRRHNLSYINALEPRRTVLWVQDGHIPVWAGPIWDWPHQSIQSNTLPIRASTIESLFGQGREIRADQNFEAADSFDIFRTLLAYATTGPGKSVYGIQPPATLAGDSQTISWAATDAKKILAVWQGLAASSDFEFTFDPVLLADGTRGWNLRLGAPTLAPAAGTADLELRYPGNVSDYAFPRIGSGSSNSIAASATASIDTGASADFRSQPPHGMDLDDLAAGYPALEDTVTYSGTSITTQQAIDTYADTVVKTRTRTTTIPTVILGGPLAPRPADLGLGAWARLLATSPLHPADAAGAPGLQRQVRIVGWTVNPASASQPETISLALGEVDAT